MLTALHRTLRDFLDYSYYLNKIHLTTSSIDKFIQKDSIVSLKQLSNKVLLPTYKFSSGWGSRDLSKKEIYSIWSHDEMINSSLDVIVIVTLIPTQPLSLLLRRYFTENKSLFPNKLTIRELEKDKLSYDSSMLKETYFESI